MWWLWWLWTGLIVLGLMPIVLSKRTYKKNGLGDELSCAKGVRWLQRTAVWLLNHLPIRIKNSVLFKGNAEAAAHKQYMGKHQELFCKMHQIRKMMLIYSGFLAAVFFLGVYAVFNGETELLNYTIERAEADGSSRQVFLEAEIEGTDDIQEVNLKVNPRKYTEVEWALLVEKVEAYIDEVLPAENADLNSVNKDLYFPSSYEGENITIEWQCENYNLIHSDGSLGDLSLFELPITTKVTAVICYGSESVYYEKMIQIIETEKTQEESLEELLLAAVTEADVQSAEASELQLPTQIGGYKIIWRYHRDNMVPILGVLAGCLIVGLSFYQEEKLKKQLQLRTQELQYAYPVFVHRMVLMLGAGMTVRRSMEQLIKDYEKESGLNGKDGWLYRELKYAWIQMESGVPETRAYMELGRRTDLPQYVKFTQLLLQWVKKGSIGMEEMMLQEAYEAEKQRRDIARKRGEIAGTKLLLPMMLLLVIVLTIVMTPAFMSM